MVKEIYLYNTASRKKEKFQSMHPGEVRLYTCGPTVYHYAHIGNLRTYVFEDLLVRSLKRAGYQINHVMNITDVGHLVSDGDSGEDKMEQGARRTGKSIWDLAQYYSDVFFSDLKKLNILKPQIIPKATDHIPEMIALVQSLEKKGFVYRTEDGLYFDTEKFPTYKDFAKLDVENLEAGKRVSVGEKKNPTDFALWKFSPVGEKRQMEWDSPWGRGFPGWHIECSAMAMKYLGETFDIHCGGIDHIPVHHTNEIAQSEAATGKRFANFWMHGEFLNEESGKMSKSKGEFLTLSVLEREGFDPLEYRFLLMQAHYRSSIKFSFDALKAAQSGYQGVLDRIRDWKDLPKFQGEFTPLMQQKLKAFDASLFDDLNYPEGLAVMFSVLKESVLSNEQKKVLIENFDESLGLRLLENAQKTLEIPQEVLGLAKQREEARKKKDWVESDRIRLELQKFGFKILDSADGAKITKI
jgi:cysteinyl-tRNA synthetase